MKHPPLWICPLWRVWYQLTWVQRQGRGIKRGYLPPGVSFLSAGLPKSPNVEPLVAVEVPAAVPSFLSPSFGGPNRFVVMVGVASFLSSGFVASLLRVAPNSPPPVVPPAPPMEKPPGAGGTGDDVPEASGFFAPNKLLPNPEVVVEVDVVVALSVGLGGSPKSPPAVEVVVFVDESPAGLGGPPNRPPGVVFVFSGPPKRLPEVAAKYDQHQQESRY